MSPLPRSTDTRDPPQASIAAALAACRGSFLAVGLFSGALNLLLLTGSLFMLQVYDRVLPSRSVPTLVALVALVLVLYIFQGVLDLIRGRMLVRIGRSLDEALSVRVYEALVRLPLRARANTAGTEPIRDLDQVRSFLSGLGPTALFDLPWMPLYLGLCFVFHVWIGLTATAGAILLIGLALVTETKSRAPSKEAAGRAALRMSLAEASRRNAEVLQAMGMTRRFGVKWGRFNAQYIDAQEQASDVTGGLGALSRVLRMALQSGVLAVGAYLVIHQEATPGVIIASSILTARALAPVELAIAHWRGFIGARQSWHRLGQLLARITSQEEPMALPAPTKQIAVEAVTVAAPGTESIVIRDVSFRLQAGQGLGVIGPTGSGKSSLARTLVSVWQPLRGTVRIDGAALDQWAPDDLGKHVGYLPQDIELFDGTVAENISRFSADAKPLDIIAAAQAADIHALILRLPHGYESRIGEAGMALSGGERQRIARARALFGDPFFIVLDEPNSNLDSEGEQALAQAIEGVRKRNGVVVVIAHRAMALAGVDLVLAMAHGRVHAFGPRDEVLQKVLRPSAAPPANLKVVAEG